MTWRSFNQRPAKPVLRTQLSIKRSSRDCGVTSPKLPWIFLHSAYWTRKKLGSCYHKDARFGGRFYGKIWGRSNPFVKIFNWKRRCWKYSRLKETAACMFSGMWGSKRRQSNATLCIACEETNGGRGMQHQQRRWIWSREDACKSGHCLWRKERSHPGNFTWQIVFTRKMTNENKHVHRRATKATSAPYPGTIKIRKWTVLLGLEPVKAGTLSSRYP